MKRLLLAAIALCCASVSAQTINVNQIRPSTTDGQVVSTVGGKTVWAAGGSGGAVFPGTNGIVFNTSTTASRNAIFSDIVPLWGSGTCSGYLKSDGTCDTPSGATFPGSNGVVFNTSTTAARNATFSDIVPLWGSGSCSGFLKSDGTCGSGGTSVTLQTNGSNNASQTLLNLIGGTNVTLSNTGGAVTINASGGGGGSLLGTAGTVNASNGSGAPQLSDILSTAPARVNNFGDSKCAGSFTGGPSLSFSGIWDSVFEQQATPNYQCISSQSAADVATQVYATTFANTDKSLIADATNDGSLTGDQYYHNILDLAAYAAIPDGATISGYPAKTKGTALTWSSGTCTTGTFYAITVVCPTGAVSSPIGFVGDHFYLSLDPNNSALFTISIAFDGGASFSFGPMGGAGCARPYCWSYNSHLNGYTYAPYLLRVPMLTGGRNTYHTAIITITTGPTPINWAGGNGAAVLYSGPQVVIPNLEQENGDTLGAKSLQADLVTSAVVGQLSADGLNVVKADVAGMLNWYAGPNVTVNGTTTSGSPTITTSSVTGTVNVGMGLSGNGFAFGAATVVAVGSGTVTMSANASATNASPVAFTGNGSWANAIHEDAAGALVKAQAIGRAASPLANGKLPSYSLSADNYFTTSMTTAAFNGIAGTSGFVALWPLPFPAQLVSIDVTNQGQQASCTSTTNTSSVALQSATAGNPLLVKAFFSGVTTSVPAASMTFTHGDSADDIIGGDTIIVQLGGYTGTGCTAGNTITNVTALWEKL